LLVFAFVTGVTFYRWGDRIPWDWRLAACAGAWALLAPVFIHGIGIHLTPIATTYLTVYLGLQNPKKWWVLSTGDYSYGMYLYGYPIQQAVMAMNPALRHWWINLLIAYPLAAAFAFASWHLVEKHALKLKGRLLRAENSAISTTQMGQRGLKSFRARWKQESNV
jgi:peptidoglycan/LPS O-acetylase OafA/YrhL